MTVIKNGNYCMKCEQHQVHKFQGAMKAVQLGTKFITTDGQPIALIDTLYKQTGIPYGTPIEITIKAV